MVRLIIKPTFVLSVKMTITHEPQLLVGDFLWYHCLIDELTN
ncbi:hypothetical protein MGSAQ_003016 [marine sediment metagenome]|uniref:Uncharacterized protein n=1 Tax=marine sediment metagenome TaxID=412755 RepID=A0A1B6NRW8_9ZZZZ